LQQLVEQWWADAGTYNVLPLDDRAMLRSFVVSPSALRNQREWILYPGMAPIPDETSPNTIDRSYAISADIIRTTNDQDGVLVSRGSRFGGFTFYVADGYLAFEENVAGSVTTLVSDEPLPLGRCTVAIRFERDRPLQGVATLEIDHRPVGCRRFDATMPDLIASTGGFRCGLDAHAAVSDRYVGPNPFTGDLHRVVVTLSDGDTGATNSDLAPRVRSQ
jgi:arylsulfatase